MQYKFFAIPLPDSASVEEELNRFLRGNRVTTVRKELISREDGVYWSFCVEYLEGRPPTQDSTGKGRQPRVDYKELLNEADFAVFCRLRDARKQLAQNEAVPVYAVCTNEQLAELARRRAATLAELKAIDGLGDAKIAKYGAALLAALNGDNANDETSGDSN